MKSGWGFLEVVLDIESRRTRADIFNENMQ